jgi:putative membrane protein
MEFLSLSVGTVTLRPYVFIFLALYLAVATLNMGFRRALIFTVLAYGVAFASEYSSTRNGFPYGFYDYIETTRGRELWLSNVPFMDSISYAFLNYISYTVALLFCSPLHIRGWDVQLPAASEENSRSWKAIGLGALLVTLLDVVIDPVANLGDRWFLGKIYTYREPGEYFNIPLTNFYGWFLVGAVILYTFTRIDRFWARRGFSDCGIRPVPAKALLGPGLYFGVLAFNLAVTFYIGEWRLGLCSAGIFLAVLTAVIGKIKMSAGANNAQR